jgi:hypothetical protein
MPTLRLSPPTSPARGQCSTPIRGQDPTPVDSDRTVEAVAGDTKVGTGCICIECEDRFERLDEPVTLGTMDGAFGGEAG